MKEIGIIVVNFNGEHLLKECFDSIFSQTYKNFDVFMIDNNSSDNSLAFIKEDYPNVKIISLKNNIGYGPADNLVIKKLLKKRYKYILTLNNDIKFSKDFIKKQIEIMKKDSQIGVLGPLIYNYPKRGKKNSVYESYGMMDFKVGAPKSIKDINISRTYEVDSLIGCSFLVRREVYEKIGFFDEEFFMYWDDYDFLQRVKKAGFKIKFVPKIKLYHFFGASSDNTSFPKKYYLTRNRFMLVKKHGKLNEKLIFYMYFALKLPYTLLTQKNMRNIIFILTGVFDFIIGRKGKRTNFYFFKTL